jgi:hypothetical protein
VHIEGNLYATGTLTASNLNVINLNTTDVEITFSEQVSITNTGTDTALRVIQTGDAPMIELQYGAMEDPKITAVSITSNGWVGIGTTTPTAQVHIEGNLYTTCTLTASNVNTTDVEITNAGSNTALKVIQTGNAPMVELQYGAMEDPKITAVSITSNGWVGIGTTAPAAPLHVADKILYKNAYATTGTLPSAAEFPGLYTGVSNVGTGTFDPYYSTGASWSPLAFYQDVLNAIATINDQKGLLFTVNNVEYEPASNIVVSGDGIFGDNSNMPQLNLYRGFTYRFSNVAVLTVNLTSNTGIDYIGLDLGIVHDNATSNASPTDKYKVRTSDQVRWTVPMNADAGSNYRYQLEIDSNVYGILNII